MLSRFLGFFLGVLVVNQGLAQNPDEIANYINNYKGIAMQEMQRTGVPAAIKLAQGIHETQAGTSELVIKSNNHFGIKCKSDWVGNKVYHDDDERGECFRSYDKPEQSYRDHSDFLRASPRYAFLFQLDPTDYKGWAWGLKKAGYATNYKYAQILVKIIETYNLQQYSLIAMGKRAPTEEIVMQPSHPVTPDPLALQHSNAAAVALPEENMVRYLPDYPTGEFVINGARVVFVKAGTALLTIAEQFNISFARLLDFNDLNNSDVLKEDQLVFLQRKRKTGSKEFHLVQPGENLYDICQTEGLRMENLLAYNLLTENMQPAAGEKLWLQQTAPQRPLLLTEKKALLQETLPVPLKKQEAATHTVQTKETLYSISKKYGVSLDQLKNWNKLDSLDLKIGQQLVIYKNQ